MHELAGSIFGRPRFQTVRSGVVRGQPSSVGAEEPLTGLRGDSRANGCVVASNQARLLERGRSVRRVIGGVRYDSRRPGLCPAVPLNPVPSAQSWLDRTCISACLRWGYLRVVGAAPEVRIRRQRTSEVGQRDKGSSSSVARRVSGRNAGPSRVLFTKASYGVTAKLPTSGRASTDCVAGRRIPRLRRWYCDRAGLARPQSR
jgi:hypothetical protein